MVLVYVYLRSWNSHFEHFLSDKMYSTFSSLFCFTETNINDSPAKHIDEILDDWKDIHKNTQHGLALCHNVSKINIIDAIEMLPIGIANCTENRTGDCFIDNSVPYTWSSWFFHRRLYFID